jgi:lysophospholipase L1-like esterase
MHMPVADSTLALFADIIESARDIVQRNGGQLWFVYLPTYERFARWGVGEDFESRGRVLHTVKALGVPIIDVYDRFASDAEWKTLWAESNIHYSQRGYALASQRVAEALRTQRGTERH